MVKTILVLLLAVMLPACGTEKMADTGTAVAETAETTETIVYTYERITAEEAKILMDTESDYSIVDARTTEEFAEAHIPGAVLIPEYEISDRAAAELPNRDQLILVYCRSGRRSRIASQALAELGYSNVKEFGGIIDWPYETVTD